MAYVPVEVSAEEIAQLETKHDDVLVMKGGESSPWTVVLRRPKRQETIAYKQHAAKDQPTSAEALIRRICVAPDPKTDEFEKQMDRWPFFCDAIMASTTFREFLGLSASEQVK